MHDDRDAARVGRMQCSLVVDTVELERSGDVDRAGERKRRNLPARRPEPALPPGHSDTVSPGAGATSSISEGIRLRSSSGVPVNSGNVP